MPAAPNADYGLLGEPRGALCLKTGRGGALACRLLLRQIKASGALGLVHGSAVKGDALPDHLQRLQDVFGLHLVSYQHLRQLHACCLFHLLCHFFLSPIISNLGCTQ